MKTCYITYIFLTILISSSCIKRSEIHIKRFEKKLSTSKTVVSNIAINSNQLLINGAGLDKISQVRITGPSNFDHTFTIESQSYNNLVANGLSTLAFSIDSTFSLFLTDATGAASFPVTFTLADNSVTASKLAQMGAGIGQVLKWNGTTWSAGDLSGLTYSGNWDAGTNVPDLTAGGNPGEYYIVNASGTTNLSGGPGTNSWTIGDWVIWNSSLSQWEKIDNATNVTSFNGRNGPITPQSGDYTWAQITKAASRLSDISNVDTPAGDGSDTGKVLKWNNVTSTWEISNDLSAGSAGSVSSTEIADGTIVNADISNLANIDQSKINGLTTNLSSLSSTVATNGTNIASNASTISSLNTDNVTEATNLYFTDSRARTATVLNTTTGTETNQAPSINAMKTYVTSAISGIISSNINDGGNTTGAPITIGTNDAQPLNLEVNNTTALTISSAGNIGIGKNPSTERLNLDGILRVDRLAIGTGGAVGGNTVLNVDDGRSFFRGTTSSSIFNIINEVGGNSIHPNLKLTKKRSGTTSPGASFGATVQYALESFTNDQSPVVAETAWGWENNQSNDTTDRDAYLAFNIMEDNVLSESMRITSSGHIGISTSTPSEKLHIVGNLRVEGSTDCILGSGSGATNCTSDKRLKENIKLIPNALDKIKSIKGVEFTWNKKARSPGRRDIGVIAQDIKKVFPTTVIKNNKGYLSVDYAVLVSPIIESIKELDNNQKKFEVMQKGLVNTNEHQIKILKDENTRIKKQLKDITNLICTIKPKTNLCLKTY